MAKILVFKDKDEMDTEEAAKYLGISKKYLYNLISTQQAPRRLRRRGRWLFIKQDLDAYLRSETQVFEAYR